MTHHPRPFAYQSPDPTTGSSEPPTSRQSGADGGGFGSGDDSERDSDLTTPIDDPLQTDLWPIKAGVGEIGGDMEVLDAGSAGVVDGPQDVTGRTAGRGTDFTGELMPEFEEDESQSEEGSREDDRTDPAVGLSTDSYGGSVAQGTNIDEAIRKDSSADSDSDGPMVDQ